MKKLLKYSLGVLIAICCLSSQKSFSQDKTLTYVGKADNDDEIIKIYDSLNESLLIINKDVYRIHSDCISESFAGYKSSSARSRTKNKSGQTRNSGGSVSQKENQTRNSGGGGVDQNNQTRNSGGNVDQKGNQTRNSGGSVDKKNNQTRNSGGSITSFSCEQSGEKIILHLPGINDKDVIKLYSDSNFIDKKYYKIKNN